MALSGSRSVFSLTRQALRQCRSRPTSNTTQQLQLARSPSSPFSSAARQRNAEQRETVVDEDGSPVSSSRPRWTHTPERMKAPFSVNVPKDPRRQVWKVNEDPEKLDAMYQRLLGRDGHKMLPDELKWLAVTHKSFDQGRRGFNTRLAFFGRQIVALETTRSLLAAPVGLETQSPDLYGRTPFEHPALANVDKLTVRQPRDIVTPDRIGRFCADVGMPEVMRWKPRMPDRLAESGIKVVLNTTLFAIVGAISLQHGAEVASRVVRDKILKRLGA